MIMLQSLELSSLFGTSPSSVCELCVTVVSGNPAYGRPPPFGNFPGQNAPPGMGPSSGMRKS